MSTTEPEPIGRTADQLVKAAADAATRPPAASPSTARPEDPDVAERRRQLRAESWARIVPPVHGDPTLAALRTAIPPVPSELVDDLHSWSEDPVRNLVIMGPVGTGKTFAAWAALRRPYGRGRSVMGLAVVDLLDALRPSAPDPEVMHKVRTTDLLLADDFGAERPTDWTAERIYSLINHRWEHQRPTIATTNADAPGLREVIGDRAYSRLMDDAVVIILGDDIGDRRKARPKDTPA